MNYLEVYQKLTKWLEKSGIQPENGRMLDQNGCCYVKQGEGRDCVIMLPEEEETLYFAAALHQLDIETEANLISFCLCLNSFSLVSLKAAAIGLDTETQQLILRSAYRVTSSDIDFDVPLSEFLDQKMEVLQNIKDFRKTDDMVAGKSTDMDFGSGFKV